MNIFDIKKALSTNFIFVMEMIISDEGEPNIEVVKAAISLAHYAWNNSIHPGSVSSSYYEDKIRDIKKIFPDLFKHLIRNNPDELIDILTKRKRMFFPNDKRLIKECYPTLHVMAIEDNPIESPSISHFCDCVPLNEMFPS